jgi:hypothetical protein
MDILDVVNKEDTANIIVSAQPSWREYIVQMNMHTREIGLAGQHLSNSDELAQIMLHVSMIEQELRRLEYAETLREKRLFDSREDNHGL